MNAPVESADRGDITVEELSLSIGGRALLDDISFSMRAAERLIIVGPNGAGKSTLLRVLAGMTLPSRGAVSVLGQRLDGGVARAELRSLRAQVGQVFQGLHLVGRLTVRENVLIGSLARNCSPLTWARLYPLAELTRAGEALAAVNMASFANARADRLSGGERQKVAIARALMQQPRLLLADEPTASLDPYAAVEIAELLGNIAVARGLTLITVVHTLSLLPQLGDRVIGLKDGRMQFDLPVHQVTQAGLQQLYAAVKNGGGAAPALPGGS